MRLGFISKNIEDSGVFYGVSFIATQETFPTCYITSACYSDNAGQFEKQIDFRDYIKYGKPEKLHWKISESLTVVEKLQ
jgi:hypothetical protein